MKETSFDKLPFGKKSFLKEVFLVIMIFLLPLTSYLHVFFIDYPTDYFLQKFSLRVFNMEVDMAVYYLSSWIGFSLLFLIWFKSSSANYKRFIFLYVFIIIIQVDLVLSATLNDKIRPLITLLLFSIIYLLTFTNFSLKKRVLLFLKKTPRDLIFAFLFFTSIFISFVYTFYPAGTKTLVFLLLELDANGFPDAQTNLYIISFKVSLLSGLLIWFFTEKKWYRYSLFSGIILLTNQLYNLVWSKISNLDEFELIQSGPFLLVVLLGLILLANAAKAQEKVKLFFNNMYAKLEKKIIVRYQEREDYIRVKRKELKQSKTVNLKELENMKQQLEKELNENYS